VRRIVPALTEESGRARRQATERWRTWLGLGFRRRVVSERSTLARVLIWWIFRALQTYPT
jgi:hypothetical protein